MSPDCEVLGVGGFAGLSPLGFSTACLASVEPSVIVVFLRDIESATGLSMDGQQKSQLNEGECFQSQITALKSG